MAQYYFSEGLGFVFSEGLGFVWLNTISVKV